MQANRDSIMKPAAAAWRYHGRPKANTGRRNLWCRLIGRRYALQVSFIEQRFMLASKAQRNVLRAVNGGR
jgi:hypothetical protein